MTHPAPHPLGIALDGGGGSVRWGAWRGEQQVAHGTLPGAVLQLLGWPAYSARLAEAIQTALQHAEAQPGDIETLGMGLSGVDRQPEVEQIYQWVRSHFPGITHCWAGNDAWPALRAGAGSLNGILLIAGTGTICLGALQKPTGELIHLRVGGWGSLLDDDGGSFAMGLRLVREACRAADGRSPHRDILEYLMARWDLTDPLQLIPFTNQVPLSELRTRLGELASFVAELAAQRHPLALELLRHGAHEDARLIATCHRRLLDRAKLEGINPPTFPIIAHGGLVKHWPAFAAEIQSRLKELELEVPLEIEPGNPLQGALALAREQAFKRL